MIPWMIAAAVLAGGSAPSSPKLLGPREILERLNRTETKFHISSTQRAPEVSPTAYAEILWPRTAASIEFPAVVESSTGELHVVEAALSPETLRAIESAAPLFRDGKYEAAAAQYEKGLQRDPKSFLLLAHLGDCHFHRGRYSEALDLYGRAIEILPTDHHLWFYKGQALVHLGLRRDAVEAFVQALVLRPGYATLLEWLDRNADALGIRVEKGPLFTPRAFARREGDRVVLYFDAARPHWLGFAACKALWMGDASRRLEATGSVAPGFNSFEERECLASLLSLYASRRKQEGFVPEPELDRLERIVLEGLADGFILYELGSRVAPWCTIAAGADAQELVRRYVRRYVLVRREG